MTRSPRRGAAAMWALVILGVLSVMSAAAVGQFAAARRSLDARERRVQALWLARSGVELAVARLAEGVQESKGEVVHPIPGGEILVSWAKGGDGVRVESEGRYNPAGGPASLTVQKVTKTVRRGRVLEVAPAPRAK